MLPNAKFVGIESLSYGKNEMSHVQTKGLPDAELLNSASRQRADDRAPLPESQSNVHNALAAARRVFSAVTLSAKAHKHAEQRVKFSATVEK